MDLQALAQRILGISYPCSIEVVPADGTYVHYENGHAKVGGSTVPALARAYMLLAKELQSGKTAFTVSQKPAFEDCGVMLDVSFCTPIKVNSVKKYLDYMALHGMNMLMLYTEDTYEVEQYPYLGYQRGRYTIAELQEIDDYAYQLGIEVIPCIQTLGHMSKYLRYAVNGNIAENATVLLPGEPATYDFIDACIAACRKAFRSRRIHIGCDETRGLGFGKTMERDGLRDCFDIFNEHLEKVVALCAKHDFHPMMWSDMYFAFAKPNRQDNFDMDTVIPQRAIDAMPDADMVFWDYYHDFEEYYASIIEIHKTFNRNILFAGGIWTWNGHVPNFRYTYDTVKPAMEACLKGGITSVFGTAWCYGDINQTLSLPCLSMYSEYCWRGLDCTKEDITSTTEFITKMPFALTEAISDYYCGMPGDYNWGKLVIWSDPLINLLCYNIDLAKVEHCCRQSLEVMKQYPDAPDIDYYTAVFQALLDKAVLHQNLRTRYKADDRQWLQNFADVTLPGMIEDFQKLYEVHDANWHRDLKTQGFEKLTVRSAGTIERLRCTQREINRYLSGQIDQIEALDPEVIHGETQLYLSPDSTMYSGG